MAQALETTRIGVEHMPTQRPGDQPRKKSQLTVVFAAETLEAIEESARRKGLAPSALIRMWAIQQLDREQGRES